MVTPASIETVPLFHTSIPAGCVSRCNGCISSTLVSGVSPESPALKRLLPDEVAAKDHEKASCSPLPAGVSAVPTGFWDFSSWPGPFIPISTVSTSKPRHGFFKVNSTDGTIAPKR